MRACDSAKAGRLSTATAKSANMSRDGDGVVMTTSGILLAIRTRFADRGCKNQAVQEDPVTRAVDAAVTFRLLTVQLCELTGLISMIRRARARTTFITELSS